jgi:hypothetical protein
MDRDTFWAVIETARRADGAARATALQRALIRVPPAQISSFAEHQAALMADSYSWPLWGAAYIIKGGCSDDAFDYFRGWLLLEGRATWDAALADPESLAKVDVDPDDAECEDVVYAASSAYEQVTGARMAFASATCAATPTGTPWAEHELPTRFPALWGRFRGGVHTADRNLEALCATAMSAGVALLRQAAYVPACEQFQWARDRAPRAVTRWLAQNNLAWAMLLADDPAMRVPALDLARAASAALHGQDMPIGFRASAEGTLALAEIANGHLAEGIARMERVLAQKQPNASVAAVRRCVIALGAAGLGDIARAEKLLTTARAEDPACALLGRVEAAILRGRG